MLVPYHFFSCYLFLLWNLTPEVSACGARCLDAVEVESVWLIWDDVNSVKLLSNCRCVCVCMVALGTGKRPGDCHVFVWCAMWKRPTSVPSCLLRGLTGITLHHASVGGDQLVFRALLSFIIIITFRFFWSHLSAHQSPVKLNKLSTDSLTDVIFLLSGWSTWSLWI